MSRKINYMTPAIEVIELEVESATAVMTHSVDTAGTTEMDGGQFDSKRRDFW